MNKDWHFFDIERIFNIYTGGDLILSRTELGEYPVVSHTYKNNGISKRISKIENRKNTNRRQRISRKTKKNTKHYLE